MKKFSLIIYLLLFALAPSLAQEVDRSKAPSPKPAPKINIGNYQSFTLKNGLKCFLVENHKLPRVSYQLTINNDPIMEKDAAGYISLAGDLMKKGTTNRTKDQINEEIDFIGANFSTSSSGIFGSALTKHQETLLTVMNDVLLNPTFPEEELAKAKKDLLSSLKGNQSDPDAISGNVADVLRYGKDHPYGELTTEKTVENITIDKIKSYHKTYFKPANAYLIIVGDIKLKNAKKQAKKYFGKWMGQDVPEHTYNKPTAPAQTQVALIDKPGAVQSVITITYPIEYRLDSKDYLAARLMNTILGSGFGGRLFKNIREDKGWTYGAYSNMSADQEIGAFSASAKVRNNVTDSAIVEFMNELKRIANEKITPEELALTKSKMSGQFARSLERSSTVAAFAYNTAIYNLPADYYQTYLQKIEAVTAEDIQKAAQKYIKPNHAYIQVVGNASELKNKLNKFGAVTQYDIYGDEVKEMAMPADLTAEKVIANYIEARGGKEKLAKITDIYTEAEANTPMGVATVIIAEKAPDMKVVIQKLNGQVMGKQILTSKKVVLGPQTITEGPMFESMKYQGLLHPELDYANLGFKLKLLGQKKIDDQAVYQVEVTDPAGGKQINSYDVKSGLLIQTEIPQAGVQKYANYLAVDGILFPYEVNMGPVVLKAKSIKVNKGIEDSMFE